MPETCTINKKYLKAPFPYFGGKSQIVDKIWGMLDNPAHYIEPFCGSLAVLFARPSGSNLPNNFAETVNDKDCIISNVWRALKNDPDRVAYYADDIISHVDLMAKRKFLNENLSPLKDKMSNDIDYYDCRIAGYYIWAASCWIGSGMLGHNYNKRPHLAGNGKGINQIGNQNRLSCWFQTISDRLKRVRIVNGDWMQVLGGNWQDHPWNSVGIYLDPPYSNLAKRTKDLYTEDSFDVAHDVRDYCIKINQKHPEWKVILSGYYQEHLELLDNGFDFLSWIANGGYSNANSVENLNRKKEVLFYNKACNMERMF